MSAGAQGAITALGSTSRPSRSRDDGLGRV